jgi:hypothetical protein
MAPIVSCGSSACRSFVICYMLCSRHAAPSCFPREMRISIALFLICVVLSGAELTTRIVSVDPAEFGDYFAKAESSKESGQNASSLKSIPTKFGTHSMRICERTKKNTPYEDHISDILISDREKPVNTFRIKGYKRFEPVWIDENLLKFEIWPSSTLELIQLVDVRSGKTIYMDARRHL